MHAPVDDTTRLDSELITEQRYLDVAYARLDAMRAAAESVRGAYSDVRAGGTHQARLERDIARRRQCIREGASPDTFVVPGGRALLERLHARGVKLYILSATLERFVRQEAALLDLARYFDGRIYGGHEDAARFSKQRVFDRILREEQIPGAQLLSFGDGPVELHHTKELGGLAVAVASDETEIGSGKIHEHKRTQLLAAGADLVIPDYQAHAALMELIFREK